MTPGEIGLVVDGWAAARRDAADLAVAQAWTAVALGRTRKLPRLESLLRPAARGRRLDPAVVAARRAELAEIQQRERGR